MHNCSVQAQCSRTQARPQYNGKYSVNYIISARPGPVHDVAFCTSLHDKRHLRRAVQVNYNHLMVVCMCLLCLPVAPCSAWHVSKGPRRFPDRHKYKRVQVPDGQCGFHSLIHGLQQSGLWSHHRVGELDQWAADSDQFAASATSITRLRQHLETFVLHHMRESDYQTFAEVFGENMT